jgi:dephospho-CoA kinase
MNANRPYLVGLTGGIATGKTTILNALNALGATTLSADEASRALTATGGEALGAIRETFGDAVFAPDGALDRRALGAIVFGDADRRRALEAILHPAVQRMLLRDVEAARQAGVRAVVMEVPLLFETGMDALCDEVWVAFLDDENRILRLMNRDRLTREEALLRIESQMPLAEKAERASLIIKTDRPPAEVEREVQRLYRDLIKRADR